MINEIPAYGDKNKLTFIRLGAVEDIDMQIDFTTKSMTFQRVSYNEEEEDWAGEEVTAADVQDELSGYNFLSIKDSGVTFRELQSMFSHTLLA